MLTIGFPQYQFVEMISKSEWIRLIYAKASHHCIILLMLITEKNHTLQSVLAYSRNADIKEKCPELTIHLHKTEQLPADSGAARKRKTDVSSNFYVLNECAFIPGIFISCHKYDL